MSKSGFATKTTILAIIALCALFQAQTFLRSDIFWLMTVGQRFLAGGTYLTQFLETNPPMSIYLYLPAVILAQKTHISFTLAAHLYTFAAIIYSLSVCATLMKIALRQQAQLYTPLLLTLTVLYTFLPGYNFGQREHFAMLFAMPYFLLAVIALNGSKVNTLQKILIGMIAGVGFSIKPHMLLAPLAVELYLLFRKRKLMAVIRPETVGIACTVLLYILAIYAFNRDYISILPRVTHFFTVFFAIVGDNSLDAINLLLKNYKILFILTSILLHILLRATTIEKNIGDIFALTTAALLVFALSEPLFFDYHFMPAFMTSIWLTVFVIFSQATHKTTYTTSHITLATIISLIALSAPLDLIYVANMRALYIKHNKELNQLITYAKHSPKPHSILFLSTHCSLNIYVPYALGTQPASRYECMWPAFYIQYLQQQQHNKIALKREIDYFTQTVIDDMLHYKPHYIYINKQMTWTHFERQTFDFLKLLTQSKRFRTLWQHYQYQTRIGDTAIYARSS